jgi:hypothetical protein
MNLELALECIREKRLIYKSQFESKKFLTGIFDFDVVLGGFSNENNYLIIGQQGCCPLLFCNLIIDNTTFLNRKSFKGIATLVKPKLLDIEKNTPLEISNLDDEVINNHGVIISVYRPSYFGFETREDGTPTENQIDFKVIKGAKYPQVSGTLSIDFEAKNISSLSLLSERKFIAKQFQTFKYENFENQLNSFIKQVELKDVSRNLHVHFEKKYKGIYDKIKNENTQLVYLNEPTPTLIGYKTNPNQKDFTFYIKPEYLFITLSVDNILNALALYSFPKDLEVYYSKKNSAYITPVIEKFLEKTKNWIIYRYQLEYILKAYCILDDVEIDMLTKNILENSNTTDLEILEGIQLENGLNLLDQINQLFLPSRRIYEPNLYTAQKIFNYIKLNNL